VYSTTVAAYFLSSATDALTLCFPPPMFVEDLEMPRMPSFLLEHKQCSEFVARNK